MSDSSLPKTTGKLLRTLSVWDGLAVAIGSVIGVGIFRTTGQVYRAAGSVGLAMLIWVSLGLFSLLGAFVYADLAIRVPEAGGPYAYVRESFGRFFAFLDGWITAAAGNPALQAAGCAMIGELLSQVIGLNAPRAFALVSVCGFVVLNWIGVHAGANAQKFFTLFKLILLSLVIGFALWPRQNAFVSTATFEKLPLILALTGTWYAYVGWQDAALLAEDLRSPQRNLPRVLIGALTVVAIAYVSVNAVLFFATRGTTLAAAQFPVREMVTQVFGTGAHRWISVLILVSMIGGTAEGFMVHPRLGFALARDRLAPPIFAAVNRGGTPHYSLLFHAAIVATLVLTNRFDQILSLLVFTQALQAILESSSYFLVRKRIPKNQITPLHPLLPALFVAANVAIATWIAIEDPTRIRYAIAVILIASTAYLLVAVMKGRAPTR